MILSTSGLEQDFTNLALADRQIDTDATSAKRLERLARLSVLALRPNIARDPTGLAHRDFRARLADSPLLQWFLHAGEVDSAKAFSKSSSDRFGQWVSGEGLRAINGKFTALLATTGSSSSGGAPPSESSGPPEPVGSDGVHFDSTCLKADIHFPIDWVLLRDAARTLMKATVLIRKHGLKNRMPLEPLEFLSEMNTLRMKMTARRHAVDSGKQRRKVLRGMKILEKCIAGHAMTHLQALKARRHETRPGEAGARQIVDRTEVVLDQLPAAIRQARERMIGGRRVANEDKILSLYDDGGQCHQARQGGSGGWVRQQAVAGREPRRNHRRPQVISRRSE